MKWSSFRIRVESWFMPRSIGAPDPEIMKLMAIGIMSTRADEVGCARCFDEMDRFVEMVLMGRHAGTTMPQVQAHLDRCNDCHEEFVALLAALSIAA